MEPLVKLPQFLQDLAGDRFQSQDGISYVQYYRAQDQNSVRVLLGKTLAAFILKGKKVLHLPEGDREIHAGEGFIAGKGQLWLSDRGVQEGGFESVIFFLDDRVIRRFLESRPRFETPGPGNFRVHSFPASAWVQGFLGALVPWLKHQGPGGDSFLELKIFELLTLLTSEDPQGPLAGYFSTFSQDPDQRLKQVMESSEALGLDLPQLAGKCHRSLASFKRDFQRLYGEAPGSWLRRRRLNWADELLRHPGAQVQDVAWKTGFATPGGFISAYKKQFHRTPGSGS